MLQSFEANEINPNGSTTPVIRRPTPTTNSKLFTFKFERNPVDNPSYDIALESTLERLDIIFSPQSSILSNLKQVSESAMATTTHKLTNIISFDSLLQGRVVSICTISTGPFTTLLLVPWRWPRSSSRQSRTSCCLGTRMYTSTSTWMLP